MDLVKGRDARLLGWAIYQTLICGGQSLEVGLFSVDAAYHLEYLIPWCLYSFLPTFHFLFYPASYCHSYFACGFSPPLRHFFYFRI